MNRSGVFKDGARLRDTSAKDSPSTSAKLLPEFDKRQSIKDMFTKKPPVKPPSSPAVETASLTQHPSHSSEAPRVSQENENLGSVNVGTISPQSSQDMAAVAARSHSVKTSDMKRPASDNDGPRPLKRTKSNATPSGTALVAGKGQQSLKGFFKAPVAASNIVEEPSSQEIPRIETCEGGSEGMSLVVGYSNCMLCH